MVINDPALLMNNPDAPQKTMPQESSTHCTLTGPKISSMLPTITRTTTVMPTFPIFAYEMMALHSHFSSRPASKRSWLSQIPMSSRMMVFNGIKQNQPVNAKKKERVANQKARMWGFVFLLLPANKPHPLGPLVAPGTLKGWNLLAFNCSSTSHSKGFSCFARNFSYTVAMATSPTPRTCNGLEPK